MSVSIPQRVRSAPQCVISGGVRAAPPALPGRAHGGAAARCAGGAAGQRHRHQDRGELRLRAPESVVQVTFISGLSF